jgi:hypothetical protein
MKTSVSFQWSYGYYLLATRNFGSKSYLDVCGEYSCCLNLWITRRIFDHKVGGMP